jgi:thiamine biosynthesis lipoprotein
MLFNLLIGRALVRWLESLAPGETGPSERADSVPEHAEVVPPAEPVETVYPRVQRRAMGSLFEVYMAGSDRNALVAAGDEALDEVERLERQLSHYLDDSDVARLNRNAHTQWVRLEPKLYGLLKRCCQLSEETGGAFDITAGPLVKAWGFFRGEGRIPTDEELTEALDNVGAYRILFDDEDHLVYFTVPGLEINLGAVGKGVAVDAAARTLRFFGVENAVIHGGQSTIYAMGQSPDGEEGETRRQGDKETGQPAIRNPQYAIRNPRGWPFEIKDPRDRETVIETVWLYDEAISTSGNYEQFFEAEGVRYSHIIDPRSGRPTKGIISASVISSSAEETDTLSTAFFVMGREGAQEYCQGRPNIRVIIVEEAEGGGITVTRIGFPPSPPE